jgi:hypothetical protein
VSEPREPRETAGEPEVRAERPAPAPRSAAAAARRARRIGGRVPSDERPEASSTREPAGVRLDKAGAPADAVPAGTEVREGTEGTEGTGIPAAGRAPVARPGWLRWVPAGVLTAAAVTLAVLVITLGSGVWWNRPAATGVRDQVLAAAKSCTVTMNTYTYTDLDSYERKALACTTGALSSDLRQAIDSIVKVRAPQLKASQTITIHQAGVESVSGHVWTVLIFAQVDPKNTNYPDGTSSPYASEVQVEKVHGQWRLSRATTLGGGTGVGGSSTGRGSSTGTGTSTPSPSPSKGR